MNYAVLDIKKLLQLPSYRYTLFLILFVLFFVNIGPIFANEKDTLSWANTFSDSFGVILFVANLGMIVVTAQFLANEYQNGTIQLSLATGVSRKTFIMGKAIALIVGTYILVLITALLAFIAASIIGMIVGSFHTNHMSFSHVGMSLLLTPLKLVPLMFVSFVITILLRSSIFSIASLMLYASLGELLITAMLGKTPLQKLLDYLPGNIGSPLDMITINKISLVNNAAILERIARESETLHVGPALAIAGITVYVLLLCFVAYTILRRQDLSR